jgi:hypothetical protein
MKKISYSLLGVLIIGFLFASCKKNSGCSCTFVDGRNGRSDSFEISLSEIKTDWGVSSCKDYENLILEHETYYSSGTCSKINGGNYYDE